MLKLNESGPQSASSKMDLKRLDNLSFSLCKLTNTDVKHYSFEVSFPLGLGLLLGQLHDF